jgi:hypothetical protein
VELHLQSVCVQSTTFFSPPRMTPMTPPNNAHPNVESNDETAQRTGLDDEQARVM